MNGRHLLGTLVVGLLVPAPFPAWALQEWEVAIPTTFPFNVEEHGTARQRLDPVSVAAGMRVQFELDLALARPNIQLAVDAYNSLVDADVQLNLDTNGSAAWVEDDGAGELWGNPSQWGVLGPTIRILKQTCDPTCTPLPNGVTGAMPTTPAELGATGALWVWDPAAGHWCYPNQLSTTTSLPSYAVLVLREKDYVIQTPSPEVFVHELGHAFGFEEQRVRESAANSVLESPTAIPNVFAANSPAVRGNVSRLGAYAQGFMRKYYPAAMVSSPAADNWVLHDSVLRRDATQPLDLPNRVVALSIYQVPEIAPQFLKWSSATQRYVECQTGEIPRFYAQVSDASARSSGCAASVALEHVIDGPTDVVVESESITHPCDQDFNEYQYKTYAFFNDADVTAAGYLNPPRATGAPLNIDFAIRINWANHNSEARTTDNEVRFTGSTALTLFPENTTDARCVTEKTSAVSSVPDARLGSAIASSKRAANYIQYTVVGLPYLDLLGTDKVGSILLTAYAAGTGTTLAGYPIQVGSPSFVGGEQFGTSVAINNGGTTIVVGAPGYGSNAGAVYVCTRSGTTVTCGTRLSPPLPNPGKFGQAVALSPDGLKLFVGEPDGDGGPGWAHAYFWNKATSAYAYEFSFRDPAGVDYGAAIATDDTWMVVGDPSMAGGGYARAYEITYDEVTGLTLTSPTDLDPLVPIQVGDRFGAAVSVHNQVLVVGAPGTNDLTGAAYVFGQPHGDLATGQVDYNYADTWELVWSLTTTDVGAQFGTSVDNHRGDVIVGAPYYDSTNPPMPNAAGAAFIYRARKNEGWELHDLIRGQVANDHLGQAVSLGGMFWVVGEPLSDQNANNQPIGANSGRFKRGPYRTLSWYW